MEIAPYGWDGLRLKNRDTVKPSHPGERRVPRQSHHHLHIDAAREWNN